MGVILTVCSVWLYSLLRFKQFQAVCILVFCCYHHIYRCIWTFYCHWSLPKEYLRAQYMNTYLSSFLKKKKKKAVSSHQGLCIKKNAVNIFRILSCICRKINLTLCSEECTVKISAVSYIYWRIHAVLYSKDLLKNYIIVQTPHVCKD